ncbi:MAG TPA: methyltransferase domain-containing protein [Thermoanaerobaculia bacterium]|nr:methyltransferase domain-containing protein [Thermoanaerobaculia bacterium]
MSIQWLHGEAHGHCPVCRDAGPKTVMLATDHVLPGWDRVTLLRCSCGAAFLAKLEAPDYTTAGSHGSDYHVEQAFGFDPVGPVLLRLPPHSVRRCLDVGCAFGLMLDFARFAFGWEVVGVDPSHLAPEGARALGLPIVHSYLSSALDLGREPFDLVICSEVLEHVADPHALLAAIGERLSPLGLLVLTTPNLDGVHEGAAPGDLARALSPGLHLVLYDSALLARVLGAAGFAAVRVETSPTTLVALAARSAQVLDRVAPSCTDRSPLLRYFDARAEGSPPFSALASGFAYRHFRDCVNAGDHAAAAASRERLAKLYGQRYGIDLERPEGAAGQGSGSFNLPGAWYFSGVLELNGHRRPERAAACFAAAAAAAEAILERSPTAVRDGETEAILLRSRVLLPTALAECDADRALYQLRALGELAVRGEIPRDACEEARHRAFVRLVHAGAYGVAEQLAPGVAAQIDPAAPQGERQWSVVELEAMYCLAMLALQQGRVAEAADGFRSLRRRLEQAGGEAAALLLGPASYHEELALQRAGAEAAARRALSAVAVAEPRAGVAARAGAAGGRGAGSARGPKVRESPVPLPDAAGLRLVIAERFVAPPARFAALRLPLDVVARQSSERLRLAVIADDPAFGERVATLRPQGLRPDEHLRLEFAPFAAPPGATFLIGVADLALADDLPVAADIAALRERTRERAPIVLECFAEGSYHRDPPLLPDERAICVFREAPPASSQIRVAHWIDQFWCDAHGLFLSGWVHAFEHRVRRLSIASGGRSVAAESFRDRPDLLTHYPEHEHVRYSGFALYLAVPAGHPVRLSVETDVGSTGFTLELPEGPLPPLPRNCGVMTGVSPILRRFADLANARGGRILQLGARSVAAPSGRLALPRRLLRGSVIGLDIHPGPLVDVVGDAHGMSCLLREKSIDSVVSAEMLEHVMAPWLVAAEINRVLKPGGLTYHHVPAAWPPHAQPNDFWRFSAAALRVLFGPETGFEVLAAADQGPATLLPGPEWRQQFLGVPTLPVFAGAEILARKVADLAPGAVAWPADAEASQRRSRCYPVDGLAPTWEEEENAW